MKKKQNNKSSKPNNLHKPHLKELRGKKAREKEREERRRARELERERERERENEDAMLSEFSDDYNDFYVDEVSEREERAATSSRREEGRREEGRGEDHNDTESSQKAAPPHKKPISPFRRKLLRILSFVLIIAVVIVVGVVLSLTVLFKTQNYEVIGNTLYNESDVIDACGIGEGTNIFLAPKQPAADRIKASFPYYEEVNVGFKIPDTIKIDITEAVEGYLVKVTDKEYLLISTKGRILDRVADKSKYDLPIFIGPKLVSGDIGDYVEYEDEKVVEMIENITQVFADNGYQGITEVDATNTASITFTYDNRIKVKLGIPEDVSYKIRTAMTIITTKIDVNPGSEIRGVLDVSRCNDTKRSYFDEEKQIDVNATEDPSAPTQTPTDEYGNLILADGGYDTGDGGAQSGDGSYDTGGGAQSGDGSYDTGDGAQSGDGSYDTGDGAQNGDGSADAGGDTYEWTPDDGGAADGGAADGAADGGAADGGSADGGAANGGDLPGNNPAEAW